MTPPSKLKFRWLTALVVAAMVVTGAVAAREFLRPSLAVVREDEQSRTRSRWREGSWLETTDESTAEVPLEGTGSIVITPKSRVRLIELSGEYEHLELARGLLRVHVAILGHPVVRALNTDILSPGGTYELELAKEDRAVLTVVDGAAEVDEDEAKTFVLAGMRTEFGAGAFSGVPLRVDAPEDFEAAVRGLHAKEIAALAAAEDAPTLWHLLRKVPEPDRRTLADKLAELVPPPAEGIQNAAVQLDPAALKRWWDKVYDAY